MRTLTLMKDDDELRAMIEPHRNKLLRTFVRQMESQASFGNEPPEYDVMWLYVYQGRPRVTETVARRIVDVVMTADKTIGDLIDGWRPEVGE